MHASVRFLAGGVFPLSALLGGGLAQNFGVQTVLVLAAVIGALAWLWVGRSAVSGLNRSNPPSRTRS